MENQPPKFASQAEASQLLKNRIGGGDALEQGKAQLEKDRAEFKAEVAVGNEADATRLGSIATGHEVHTDMSGNILSEKDQQELREKGPVGVK